MPARPGVRSTMHDPMLADDLAGRVAMQRACITPPLHPRLSFALGIDLVRRNALRQCLHTIRRMHGGVAIAMENDDWDLLRQRRWHL